MTEAVQGEGQEKATRREANRKIFDEDNVRTLPLKRKQYQVWDGGNGRGSGECVRGLSILVSPKGARSYRSTYYFPGSPKPHSRHLGRVGEISLAKAREDCRKDRYAASAGIDPRATDGSSSDTFAAAVEEYIKRDQIGQQKNSLSTANEARRILLKDCEDWHQRPVATILDTEIIRRLELVRDGDAELGCKPRPYLANSLYGRFCTFFGWCAAPGIRKIKTSPMIGIKKPWNGAKPRQRDWFKGTHADQAIRSLWQAADQIGVVEGAYLRLLLLTGKRKSALANMQWQELDDDWFWHAPQSDKKNKRLHGVPLPVRAQRILHPRKPRGFVFPGDDEGHIYVNGVWLQTKIIRASGMKDFFFHGARHLAETKMAELKVAPHIRDMLFDHVPERGSGKGYDHHDYKDEMRAALELWAGYIERLVQPAEGVPLLRG